MSHFIWFFKTIINSFNFNSNSTEDSKDTKRSDGHQSERGEGTAREGGNQTQREGREEEEGDEEDRELEEMPNFFESIKDILSSIGKEDLVGDKALQQVVEESMDVPMTKTPSCILSLLFLLSLLSFPLFSSLFMFYFLMSKRYF